MRTKLFCLLFAVAANIGTMRAAIVDGTCGENLTWSLNTKDSTLIIEGSGAMSENPWSAYNSYIAYVSLPNGLTNIGGWAFNDCTSLTSIDIPNSVTSIRNEAFASCSSLTSVTIGNSVTSIGMSAFHGCSSLTSVTIPNSDTIIGDWTFWGCTGLTSLTIGNSVTSIGERAFSGCYSLTSVTIPNSVTSIGNGAFSGCSGLNSVTIGNSVTSIGSGAFAGCSGLTSITCEAVTPPTLTDETFYNVDKSIPLFVPAESLDAYSNAVIWESFTNLFAIGTIIDTYRVEFRDIDNTILKVDSVDYGKAAVAPNNPYRQGYTFVGWDKEFSSITSDLVVTAKYELGENADFIIQFINKEEVILYNNVVLKVPAAPEIIGFTFKGWRPVAEMIGYNCIGIEAVYEADEPASAPTVYTNPTNPAQKLIKDGNVYILSGNKTFTIQGQEVK